MKITINIDCTPEEARRYMGLPDVAPMQEEMIRELQQRMMTNVASMQPDEMMKTWLPISMDSWLGFQKAFWNQMSSAGKSESDQSS